MCGRFSFTTSKEIIEQQFKQVRVDQNIRMNYNIAPTHHAYVITNDSPEKLQFFTWGLIPSWSKDGVNKGNLINARMEGIAAKPSFRMPIRKRRCLVLADSFYEWKQEAGQKVPYRILMQDDSIMVMAGIWDVWYKDDYAVKSFSIITSPANTEMKMIHNRMPIVLTTTKEQQHWLLETNIVDLLPLLKTPPNNILKIYRVSDQVNSPKNNSPELHIQVTEPPILF